MNQYEFNKKCIEVFGYNKKQIEDLLEQVREQDKNDAYNA